MLKFITHIQISRRLLLAFLLAAVIPGIIISMLGVAFIKEQNIHSHAFQTNISAFKTTATAAAYLHKLNELLNVAYQEQYQTNSPSLKAHEQDTITQLYAVEILFNKTLQQYQQNYQLNTSFQMSTVHDILTNNDPNTHLPDQQQNTLSQVVNRLWPTYKADQDRVIEAIQKKSQVQQVNKLQQQAQDSYTQLETSWDQIIQITENIGANVAIIVPAENNPFILLTIFAFLTTIIVVIAIGYAVYLTIIRPLQQLTILTRRIARGDTNARAIVSGRDEISLVAQSMNTMLDNIVHLIQETQMQRDTLLAQVEKLVSEVSGVAEGDLRLQAEVTTDTLGVLADSFNYMVEELGSLVVRVKSVAREVDSTTVAILDRMTQLVETGNRQLQQIAEGQAEIEQMTYASRQVAERSQILYNVARMARQDAQIGREWVGQAIDGMGRINENVHATATKVQALGERSREIDEIAEVMSGVAQQTNRLALDAAIQAAMAGEHGKGFGAVAADIRRLAERAKDQTSMIARIVRSVREEILSVADSMQNTERETMMGTRLTQDTAVALESIFAAVEHQAREVENINQVAMQQLQSASSAVRIMKKVSDATRFGSNNTREASLHMERLARLVEQLRISVAAFRLRENQGALPTSTTIMADEEPENPLTVSGIFRKICAAAQPVQISNMGIACEKPATHNDDSFASASATRPPVRNG